MTKIKHFSVLSLYLFIFILRDPFLKKKPTGAFSRYSELSPRHRLCKFLLHLFDYLFVLLRVWMSCIKHSCTQICELLKYVNYLLMNFQDESLDQITSSNL